MAISAGFSRAGVLVLSGLIHASAGGCELAGLGWLQLGGFTSVPTLSHPLTSQPELVHMAAGEVSNRAGERMQGSEA